MATFQTKIKELRINSGLTQQELAKKLNCSQSTITMWENGKRQPDIETLEVIADLFNVDMNFLVGTSDNTTMILDSNQFELLSLFDQLNDSGKKLILNTIRGLSFSDEYSKKGGE